MKDIYFNGNQLIYYSINEDYEKILNSCNGFTFHDHIINERVIELNYVRYCVSNILSRCNHIEGNCRMRVLFIVDDISLVIIVGNVENLVHEKYFLRVGFLHLLCLENLYEEETDKPVNIINEQEIISHDKMKSFQERKWFQIVIGI